MSADTTPISPARFASAIKDLSLSMLHLKVLEIRNSIAHLQYSNDQLRPFAEGTSVALGESSSSASSSAAAEPDQDCIDAIRENEAVIDRMAERIAIIRAEVEGRGFGWTEFQSQDEVEAGADSSTNQTAAAAAAAATTNGQVVNGEQEEETRHSAWTDGTFQTGTISSDGHVRFDSQPAEQASSANQTAQTGGNDDAEEDGLHL